MKIFSTKPSILTSQNYYPLTLFKHVVFKKTFTKSNIYNVYNYPAMNFKSFFVFLKPKPFIIKMRYNLLTNFSLNPRPYSLSTFIRLTKRFRSESINNYFQFSEKNFFLSKKKILFLVLRNVSKVKKKNFFNLFKYKLFQYTTPKKIKLFYEPNYSHILQLDFRTGLIDMHYKKSFPNVTTISTYNWKIIN